MEESPKGNSQPKMTKRSEPEDRKKREKIQRHFWNEVGSDEHISTPELENAVRNEFKREDDRRVQAQINLMQTEQRIRIESKAKVCIRQPPANSS
jgi:hypothetical protein